MTDMNQQWILKQRPKAQPTMEDLQLVETPVPAPAEGEFLARTVYLSLDPAQRISMSDRTQYSLPVEVGAVMRGFSLSQIVESCTPDFAVGDFIRAPGGWRTHWTGVAGDKVSLDIAPLEDHMSLLGVTGSTAYFGLLENGAPQVGETVVVSAAAGAVGSIAGQIAKIKGCRVVGIAGSDEKCRHVVEALGFDACVNYKSGAFSADLAEACPDGIDVYFENVGGEVLDIILTLMNNHGRIPICGLISTYNRTEPLPGPYNFDHILMKRLIVRGFLIGDYFHRMGESVAQLAQWKSEGRIVSNVHIVEGGIAKAMDALSMLFTGANTGKVLLKVSEP